MRINFNPEPTIRAWWWRLLLGPSILLDGLLSTLTLGTVSLGAGLATARLLSRARTRVRGVMSFD